MRKAVTISDGSRILPGPLDLLHDLKTSIYFLSLFVNVYFVGLLFRTHLGYGPRSSAGAVAVVVIVIIVVGPLGPD